jgi:hypothetical protein
MNPLATRITATADQLVSLADQLRKLATLATELQGKL